MAIVKESRPYEYLVRFDNQGNVRGQHIKYIERVYDDQTGEVYAEREAEVLPVGAEAAQIPLQTALGDTFAQAAKATQAAIEAKEQAELERDLYLAERDAARAERDQLLQPTQSKNVSRDTDPG